MNAVEFVDWHEGIYDDMFIEHIYVRIDFEKKSYHGFFTSCHCYKTGDYEAEMKAAIALTLEDFKDKDFYRIEAKIKGMSDMRLSYGTKKEKAK